MKIIPKFQNESPSDWYYGLNIWKQPKLPGLLPPRGGNYNNKALKDRQTGINLDRAYQRNNAYINANKNIRQGDVSNYFNNGVDYGSLQEALNAYNADIDVLDNTFSSGNFNYDTSKWNAVAHNNTFKKVYESSAQNGSELYKTGWDENQIGQGGSATWERRAVKYSTKFEDDLAMDPKAAMDRVYETPYGQAYVDETGRLRPLSEEQQEALGIIPKGTTLNPCIQSYIKQGMDEAHARALCEGNSDITTSVNPEDLSQDDDPTEPVGNGSKSKRQDVAKKNVLSNLLGKASELSPMLFGAARVAIDNALNRKATDEYLSNVKTPWQTPQEAYRMIHGDYIAKQEGERQAAKLRNAASVPFVADADKHMSYMLEAVDKGYNPIMTGQQRDANEFYRTSEVAAQQGIQNIQNRTNTANMNSQLNSQYEEMKARVKRDQKIHNMQNWDRWGSVWEDRALAQYDYNQQRKRNAQEQLDSLSDSIGTLDDEEYLDLYYQYRAALNSGDTKKAERFRDELYNLKKRNQLQVYRNLGDRLGVTWNGNWNKAFDKYKVTSVKNGGILRKLQQGGGFPYVEWTPLMGRPYQTYLSLLMSGDAGSSSRASKSSQSSSSTAEKEEATLLKSIVETLKGGDLLPSDVGVISQQLKQFFDIQRYAPEGTLGVDSLYRGYIDALSYVNRAKYGANTIKEAKTHLDNNKALNSYAIDQNGAVYAGKVGTKEITRLSPDDALKVIKGENQEYRILTNSDLLAIRSELPTYAFSDSLITTAATSATSMEAIAKYVKDFIGTLGSDKQSRDIFARDFGQSAEQGLAVLNNIKNQGFSEKETEYIGSVISGAGSINSLLELNVATESQLNQAKMALRALSQSLPLNMQALLYLQGGGQQGADEILTNLVLKGTSSQFGFKINDVTPFNPDGTLGSSSKTGKGSSSSGEDKYKLSTTAQWISGMGEQTTFNINPESKGTVAWQVTGNTMPVTDMSDKSMEGAFTLQDISGNSTLDLQHAYIGNTKITSLGLGKVLITDPNITRVALPVTVDELGGVKPYFERITLVNQINTELKNKNIPTDYVFDHVPTEQEKESIIRPINKAYQSKGLPSKYDENTGKLNFGNYKYFGLIKGFSPKSALDPSNEFDNDLLKELSGDQRDDFEARIKKIDSNFKFDNGWFSNEPVYEGIIFIPLRDNIFNSQAGKGSTYAPENPNAMQAIDAIQQKSDTLKAQGRPPHPIIKGNFNQ